MSTAPVMPSQPEGAAADSAEALRQRTRRRGLTAVAMVVVMGLAGGLAWWWFVARWQSTTSDAYVNADIAQVSALTSGTVKTIRVHAGQQVRQGDVLVELDDADARIALEQAEAALARAVRGARSLSGTALAAQAGVEERRANAAAARANLDAADAALVKAEADLARQSALAQQGFVSPEALAGARLALQTARAAHAAALDTVQAAQAAGVQARAQAEAARAPVDSVPLPVQPDVAQAAANVRQAALALARTRILAPIDGVAGPRSVQLGQRLSPGAPVVSIVPIGGAVGSIWVDANFKETELASLRIGQKVALTADVYGQTVAYTGAVGGITPATGSALSLLPAQNATGNWIKIVQRVPVRIWLDPGPLAAHPLQVGLSMNVTVDLRDASGPRLGLLPAAARVQQTAIYDGAAREAEARIRQIIAAHAHQGG